VAYGQSDALLPVSPGKTQNAEATMLPMNVPITDSSL